MVGTENGTLTGPIPAHAGEPRHLTATLCPGWAYPRSRGGTVCGHQCVQQQGGLSPLTRGNHGQRVEMGQHLGPIPAHAGEPDAASCCPSQAGAYPRSRGGTVTTSETSTAAAGLSPLTRGNRDDQAAFCWCTGPIPAHAGEPGLLLGGHPSGGAYPRSRGGTGRERLGLTEEAGLSPLTRGNLSSCLRGVSTWGPIPAHAGEPTSVCRAAISLRAYPRSRGGT